MSEMRKLAQNDFLADKSSLKASIDKSDLRLFSAVILTRPTVSGGLGHFTVCHFLLMVCTLFI